MTFKSEPEANRLCNILKTNKAFEQCRSIIDISSYVESCRSDLCTDASSYHKDLYLCKSFTSYAFECANKGIIIDWFENKELIDIKQACNNTYYGICPSGSFYSECSRIFNATCKDLSNKNELIKASKLSGIKCLGGCSCPGNKFFDVVEEQIICVDKNDCSCYDSSSKQSYQTGYILTIGCSNW